MVPGRGKSLCVPNVRVVFSEAFGANTVVLLVQRRRFLLTHFVLIVPLLVCHLLAIISHSVTVYAISISYFHILWWSSCHPNLIKAGFRRDYRLL